MKQWVNKALVFLQKTLSDPKHELNEIDWKAGVSPDAGRLAEHLCAFSNYPGGGFLTYGISNTGCPEGVDSEMVQKTMNHLSNIGRHGIVPSISLDHSVERCDGHDLLFVCIRESAVRPVCVRGNNNETHVRSGGTTRKASSDEFRALMLNSKPPKWENLRASDLLEDVAIPPLLETSNIFKLLAVKEVASLDQLLQWMAKEKYITQEPAGGAHITNLGAIAAAKNLSDFPDLQRKAVRVIVYNGLNKTRTKSEQVGVKGYAVGFQGLLNFVTKKLPKSEVIEKALRRQVSVYPENALREIIANALIHQDFTVTGAGPLIEIFDDRIEVTSPGKLLPSQKPDRLIGTQPESRNQDLATAFRHYRICEERGSGLTKAGREAELYGLPPIEFFEGQNYFKVTIRSPRTFAQMTGQERLLACYQHTCLKHVSSDVMTNKSLRERLKMPEKQRSLVSLLIQEAIDQTLVKNADPTNKSKKFSEYLPYWA